MASSEIRYFMLSDKDKKRLGLHPSRRVASIKVNIEPGGLNARRLIWQSLKRKFTEVDAVVAIIPAENRPSLQISGAFGASRLRIENGIVTTILHRHEFNRLKEPKAEV